MAKHSSQLLISWYFLKVDKQKKKLISALKKKYYYTEFSSKQTLLIQKVKLELGLLALLSVLSYHRVWTAGVRFGPFS